MLLKVGYHFTQGTLKVTVKSVNVIAQSDKKTKLAENIIKQIMND